MGNSIYRETSQKESLIKVAHMYYIGQMTQEEIAESLNCSRAKVVRMLKDAKKRNIVTFQIVTPDSYYTDQAECIRKHFSLKKVVVVPSENTSDASKRKVADAACQYLQTILHDNMIIGITWGTTVGKVAKYMPEQQLSGCGVYALNANLSSQNYYYDSYAIVSDFAAKLHATKHVIDAPEIVQDKKVRDMLIHGEPRIAHHFDMFRHMDVAIVGLGTNIAKESTVYQSGNLSLEDVQKLHEQEAVADVVGIRIMDDGTPANTFLTDRVITIPLEDLAEIPDTIAVATGRDKTRSAIAAARGHYYNTLFIDETLALSIIAQENISP